MRSYIIILTLLLGAFPTLSQTRITGRVLDKAGSPSEGFVTLSLPGESTILNYADIDTKGIYTLTYTGKADSLCVRVSGFMIGNYVKVVANKSQIVDFNVEEREVELKEVSIKADPVTIKGDTTDYLVGAYAEQGDRVIGDVLKKIPGIEVSGSGGISYNGKPISKFYVEEMDMLHGRYGLAVNNLSADDVSKVQVMEHHQPIKMLQGRAYSEDVAVNLKLKDKAKGTYALTTSLGGGLMEMDESGARGLWNEELIGMYFGKDRQTMQTYKGNNSADNIMAELSNQYGSGAGPRTVSRVGLLRPGTPSLPQKRWMDNKTHAASANWLERLSKYEEVTFNAVYTHDWQQRAGYTYTEHYRPDTLNTSIHETQTSIDKAHHLDLSHKYTNNAESKYSTNDLSFQISWNDGRVDGMTRGNSYSSSVFQNMHSMPLSVSDRAMLQRILGNNIFRFNLSAGYAQSSQTLGVTDADGWSRRQELMSRTVSLSAFTSYERGFGPIRGEYGFSATGSLYGEDGTLTGLKGVSEEDCKNRMWYGMGRLSVFQTYSYRHSHGNVALGLPVILDIQTSDDRVRRRRHTFLHPIVLPSLSSTYEWNIYHTLNSRASYEQQVGDLNNLFQGYVMENYREVVRSQMDKLLSRRSVNLSTSYRYSNALQQLHFNANVSYGYTWLNQMESVIYDGIYCNSVFQDLSNTSSSLSAGMGLTKNFSWLRSYLKMNAGYSLNNYQRLIDGTMMDYRRHSGNLNVSGAFTPIGWMTVVMGFGGMLSKTQNDYTESGTVKDYTGRLSLKLCPTKRLTLTVSGEGTYDNWTGKDNYRYFSDVKVQYAFKHVTLELEGNNLSGQKKYVMTRNTDMDIYHLEYDLRPRNFLVKLRFKIL